MPLLEQLAGTEWDCNALPFRHGRAGGGSGSRLAFHEHDRFGYYFWLFQLRGSATYCISELQGRYRVTDLMSRGHSLLGCQQEEWATLEIRREATGSLQIFNHNEGIEVLCQPAAKLTPEEIQRLQALD